MRVRMQWLLPALACLCLKASAAPPTLSGRALLLDGKPAAGAKVWITYRDSFSGAAGVLASTRTDASGHFTFPGPNIESAPRVSTRFVVVHVDGYALAWSQLDDETGSDIKLTLAQAVPHSGMVMDESGKALPGVRVRLDRIVRRSADRHYLGSLLIPDEIGVALSTTTDEQGRWSQRLVGSVDAAWWWLSAPGHASLGVPTAGESGGAVLPPLRLPRAVILRGRIKAPDVTAKVADLPVTWSGRVGSFLAYGRLRTSADGSFEFTDVTPGQVSLTVACPPDQPWQFVFGDPLTVKAGETRTVSLTLERSTLVTGRIVADGHGIPGVTVFTNTTKSNGRYVHGTRVVAGDDGRFSFHSPPGEVKIALAKAPRGFSSVGVKKRITVGDKPADVGDIELPHTVALRVQVVDEAGQPVPDAEVCWRPEGSVVKKARTDSHGRFTIEDLNASFTCQVQASKGEALAEQVTVRPGERKEPLRITLRKGIGVRLRARIIDDAGQPVPEAAVFLQPLRDHISSVGPKLTVDAGGRVISPLLPPDCQYALSVAVQGAASTSTEFWQAVPGQTHDFGDIVVRRERGFVAGVIVDAGGKPVHGARVWNRGQSSSRAETSSNANGRFRVTGLQSGPVCIFAEAAGYRLAFFPTQTGESKAKIVLRDAKSPPPPPRETPAPLSPSDREAFVRELLNAGYRYALSNKTVSERRWAQSQYVAAAARIDIDLARMLSAIEKGALDAPLGEALFRRLAADNPAEAVAFLRTRPEPGFPRGTWSLVDHVVKLARTNPDQVRRLVSPALLAVRSVRDPGYRIFFQARLAGALLKLGLPAGARLRDECLAAAPAVTGGVMAGNINEALAPLVATTDIDAALELVESSGDDYGRRSGMLAVIRAIAEKDLDQALKLADRMAAPYERELAYRDIAFVVGHRDLEAARRILARIEEYQAARCTVLLWLAADLADRNTARALVDEAVDFVLATTERGRVFSSIESPDQQVGLAALVAHRLQHPLARELGWRALSMRMTHRDSRSPLGGGDSRLMLCIAQAAPDAARWWIESVWSQLQTTTPKSTQVWYALGSASIASWLVDPHWCRELLSSALHSKQGLPVARLLEYILAADQSERERIIDEQVGFRLPGQEP